MQGQESDTPAAAQVAPTAGIILPFAEIAAAYAAVRADRDARPEPVYLPIPEGATLADGTPIEEVVLLPIPIAWEIIEGEKHAAVIALRFKYEIGEPLPRILVGLPADTKLAQSGYEKMLQKIMQKPPHEALGIFGQEHPVSAWSTGVSIQLGE